MIVLSFSPFAPSRSAVPVAALGVALLSGVSCVERHVLLLAPGGLPDAARTDGPDAGDGGAAGADVGTLPDGARLVREASAVTVGREHVCAIGEGALFCWGHNGQGRLGLGDTQPRYVPARVGLEADWLGVVAAMDSTVAVKSDGTMWTWGSNEFGQIGQGDAAFVDTPTRLGSRSDWIAVSAHFTHVCAIARDRSLWCWGHNGQGSVGSGTAEPLTQLTPAAVAAEGPWSAVATGGTHACAIRQPGVALCWGDNSEGDLGLGETGPFGVVAPTEVAGPSGWHAIATGLSSSCGLRDGALLCWGPSLAPPEEPVRRLQIPTPVEVPIPSPLVEVSMDASTCVRSQSGEVACWGLNLAGELGFADKEPRALPVRIPGVWTAIAAGWQNVCGIREGTVFCAGSGAYGMLGQGEVLPPAGFVPVTLPR